MGIQLIPFFLFNSHILIIFGGMLKCFEISEKPGSTSLILIIIFTFFSHFCYSQGKQANVWCFGAWTGFDFNQGSPPSIISTSMHCWDNGSASIADSNGNLQFYSDGQGVYNNNHFLMENGDLLGDKSMQGAIIIPRPGHSNLYYIFYEYSVPLGPPVKFLYSMVDMNLANGMGAVVDSMKDVTIFNYTTDFFSAVHHDNGIDYWVVAHGEKESKYYAWLVSYEGVSGSPVISDAGNHIEHSTGVLKLSPSGKKIAIGLYFEELFQILDFNNQIGTVNDDYAVTDLSIGGVEGIEYSPNNRFLYLNFATKIFQYDLEAGDPNQILESKTLVYTTGGLSGSCQIAPDGKIYINTGSGQDVVSIIHEPNNKAPFCNFEYDALYIGGDFAGYKFPTFIQSYFNDPEFETQNNCLGDATEFTILETNGMDSVFWKFNDFPNMPYDTSTSFNPVYTFSYADTFLVELTAYSNLNVRTVTQEVIIHPIPEPDLGNDTLLCDASFSITLNANCQGDIFGWSTGQFGTPEITVSDTGWYWVRVENDAGCFEIDSIHLSFLPEAIADTSGLEVIPTTCGGSTGVIKGLSVSGIEPLSWQWIDDLGNPISNSLDIYHLPVGNYTLEVLDGNGCTTSFGPYTIIDAGDVLIDEVEFSNEHCGQQDGSIIVNATSGLSDMLFYSIDNGANYYTNQGVFTGLAAGSYAVRVRDSSDCQDVFINNPIIIENLDAPEILSVNIGACAQGQSNGSIEISALGGGDTLYYSNDNGLNYQINDGGFFSLLAGFYTCIVMDEVGCDTTFVVEVPEEITLRLQAIAGEDEVCPGNAAFVPLYVSNFNDVANFRTTLFYDNSLISCSGFANAHSQLEDSLEVLLFPAEGKVELSWHAPSVTLPANTVMADLVFESLDPGLSMVAWDGSAGASHFENSAGLTIPVDYYLGCVRIYEVVFFTISPEMEACQGDNIEIIPMLWSSNGPASYLWTDPIGSTSNEEILSIIDIQQTQSGTYTLRVSDTLDCYSEASVNLIVHPAPVPAFAGQDTIITEEPIELDAGENYASYYWNTGAISHYITAEYDDWYSVVIESALGCLGEDSVYVFFLEPIPEPIESELHLPNAFTPDGNGLNDEFKVINPPDNLSSFHMYIFNRWGQKIFESKDVMMGWDGTIKGAEASAGTYVFRVNYSINGYDFDALGTVVLVR